MFGKLTEKGLEYAPKPLTVDGRVHYHPSDELYRSLGYLPIIETPYPEVDEAEPKYYEASYIEENGQIVKVWSESEAPEPVIPEPTLEEKIAELKGRVSANEENITNAELAIVELYETLEGAVM